MSIQDHLKDHRRERSETYVGDDVTLNSEGITVGELAARLASHPNQDDLVLIGGGEDFALRAYGTHSCPSLGYVVLYPSRCIELCDGCGSCTETDPERTQRHLCWVFDADKKVWRRPYMAHAIDVPGFETELFATMMDPNGWWEVTEAESGCKIGSFGADCWQDAEAEARKLVASGDFTREKMERGRLVMLSKTGPRPQEEEPS